MSYVPCVAACASTLGEWNIIETEHVVGIGAGHFGHVDSVVCVSHAVRDAHRKYEGAWRRAAPHFRVIYNGLELESYNTLSDKAPLVSA